ncbi:MAG: hypothetical protein J5I93_21005 [Pirellulaceae bacterium]|nr:hypothetical protein [Pirellulaceae bacterium]
MLLELLFCLVAAVFFGLSLWFLATLHTWTRRNRAGPQRRNNAAASLSRRSPPEPYQVRLARYLRVAPEELRPCQLPGESRMPLWISPLVVFERRSPRTRDLIRYFLERIRRTVRGASAGLKPGRVP